MCEDEADVSRAREGVAPEDLVLVLSGSCTLSDDQDWKWLELDAVREAPLCKLVSGVELLLTAPCPVPISQHPSMPYPCILGDDGNGVGLNTLPAQADKMALLKADFRSSGLVILENCLRASFTQRLLDHCLEHIDSAEKVLKRDWSHLRLGQDMFTLREMSSRGPGRFDLLFEIREERHKIIHNVAFHGAWMPVITSLLGEDVLCDTSVIYSRPGAADQEWHADGM